MSNSAERVYIAGRKGGCFPAGTKIRIHGGVKNIEDVRLGDLVLSFNDRGEIEPAYVIKTYVHASSEITGYLITFHHERGTFSCTSNHWVLHNDVFVEAGDLKPGDLLTMFDGSKTPIQLIERNPLPDVVYNLTCDPNHTVFMDDVRCHQKGGGKDGGGGGSPVPAKEAPNTLRSRSTARVLDLISEGEIGGLVDGLKSVYIDDTPIMNPDGTYNFEGITVEERVGTPDQTYITGFPGVESSFAVNLDVKYALPAIKTVTNELADAALVVLRWGSMVEQNTTTGDMNGTSVEFAIDVKPTAGSTWTQVRSETLSGKCTSAYEVGFRVERPAAATAGTTWDVRVRRLTIDPEKANVRNEFQLASITELVDDKFIYPDSAIIAMAVDAEITGGRIPSRAYEVEGIKIKVPTGYNPDTRTYPAIWDGTFTLAVSDNPAWILYDILTNERYGMGEFTKTGSLDGDGAEGYKVDKYAMYTIAKYCDEMVADGFGNYEPRFAINTVITTRQDAFKLIQTIASAFRGMVYVSNDTVIPIQDSPKDPVKLVNPSNVLGGEFTYRSTSLTARHTTALVTWNDPNNRFLPAIEVVEDFNAVRRYGYNPIDVVAFGCTSRGQANRYGKWILETEKNETETVNYRASLDHADVFPGNIILLSDPNYHTVDINAMKDLAGRIKSFDTGTGNITLDRSVVLANKTYSVFLTLPDGTAFQSDIEQTNGTFTVISCVDVIPQVPVNGSTFILADASTDPSWEETPRKFRVLAKREVERNIYEITAVAYDENKYLRVEQGLNIEPLKPTPLDVTKIMPPTNFVWEVQSTPTATGLRRSIIVSFDKSVTPFVMGYKIEYRVNYGQFVNLGVSPINSFEIPDPIEGYYEVRVTAIHVTGRTSVPATDDYDYSEFDQSNVPQITGLEVGSQGNNNNFAGTTCYINWRKNSVSGSNENWLTTRGVDGGFMDSIFQDYEVVVLNDKGKIMRTRYVKDPMFWYGFDEMLADTGTYDWFRTFTVHVRWRSIYNTYSKTAKLTCTNPAPEQPTNVRVFGANNSSIGGPKIIWKFDKPTDPDWRGTYIFVSTDPKFQPSSSNCIYDGQETSGMLTLNGGNTYYVKIASYDVFGQGYNRLDQINISGSYQVAIPATEQPVVPPY